MGQLKVNSITDEAGTGPVEFPLMPEVNGNPVIERGSNANGAFVKYADGTMICTNSSDTIINASGAAGNVFLSGDATFTFPSTFVAEPIVATGLKWAGGTANTAWGMIRSVSATSVVLQVYSHGSAGQGMNRYTAIGRWF
jgi:hypothetical protein